jgi:hypothetical protein
VIDAMFAILVSLVRTLRSAFRFHTDLALENLALRQQLSALDRCTPQVRLRRADRAFWIGLSQIWARWSDALIIVKPDTVVRWHRAGFRLFWRWKSRARTPAKNEVSPEVKRLIRCMAEANVTWGAPKIHGELLKLGIVISESSVSRFMPRKPRNPPSQTWRTFPTTTSPGLTCLWARTRLSPEPSSRQAWARSWSCPKSAVCITDTSGRPPDPRPHTPSSWTEGRDLSCTRIRRSRRLEAAFFLGLVGHPSIVRRRQTSARIPPDGDLANDTCSVVMWSPAKSRFARNATGLRMVCYFSGGSSSMMNVSVRFFVVISTASLVGCSSNNDGKPGTGGHSGSPQGSGGATLTSGSGGSAGSGGIAGGGGTAGSGGMPGSGGTTDRGGNTGKGGSPAGGATGSGGTGGGPAGSGGGSGAGGRSGSGGTAGSTGGRGGTSAVSDGAASDGAGAVDACPVCPPMRCTYGSPVDGNGCTVCECNPAPDGAMDVAIDSSCALPEGCGNPGLDSGTGNEAGGKRDVRLDGLPDAAKCGNVFCGPGEVCCNPLTDTCVTPGGVCAL